MQYILLIIFRFLKYIKNLIFRLLPDESYIKLYYWYKTGERLNLKFPRSFNEKLNWLKLHDRNPEYTKLVDKYEVREIVGELIGDEYLVPLIGVYQSFDEIDFEKLPEKFVLKSTHDSGGVVVCRNKNLFDKLKAKEIINKSLKRNYFYHGREWPYKNVLPKIICEKYISKNKENSSLVDYKFYCFNGTPLYCQVIRDRGVNETIDFYDLDWNVMPFNGLRSLPNSTKSYSKPGKYNKMIKLAGLLAQSYPFVRIDFYYVKGKIYFGEYTFYPQNGVGSFTPKKYNYKIGELIRLNKI